jgi:TolA-binding protein
VTRFYTICRCLLWVMLGVGCATTRYEEFGEAPKEEVMRNAAAETMPLLEQRIRDLEERVGRIEAELVNRFTGFETSQGDLATRVMALAEQLEALSMQVQNGPKVAPPRVSSEPMIPTMSLERLYEQGLGAYYDRQYVVAQEKFERLIQEYPTSSLADNSQYWVGECEYGQKHYQSALDAFHSVFQYDKTEKDDDAQFMLGQSYHQLGNLDSALVEFNRLKIDYPESEYIGRAEAYIRRIRAAQNAGP